MNKTLKVYQVIDINSRIKNIIEGESVINAAFKFKLLRLYSEIQGVVKDFEITKDSLVNKYGKDVVDESGEIVPNQKRISPEDENWKDFIKEINAVSDSDVDVNFTPISVEELFGVGLDTDACADLIPIVEE